MITYRAKINDYDYLEITQDGLGRCWWYLAVKKGFSPIHSWSPTMLGAKRMAKYEYNALGLNPFRPEPAPKLNLKWELIDASL